MSKNVVINDTTYEGVSNVQLTTSDGGCHQIHVPAITALKKINSASSEPGVIGGAGYSQCWIADVYTDRIVMQGINAHTGESIENIAYTITL